ncbi:hypothetical protein CHCC20335_3247 [Bacillus paralicheniformis]|nr:hypothetical protein CHCC20335_3247 [Bacillus paralicheniformis]
MFKASLSLDRGAFYMVLVKELIEESRKRGTGGIMCSLKC